MSLVELAVAIVVLGILAAVAAPRLGSSEVDEARFRAESLALIRYAQKSAIAQRRNVCLAFTAQSITASVSASAGGACTQPLAGPSGASPYVAQAGGGAGFSSVPAAIVFDARGVPDNPQNLAFAGISAIVIEAGSAYVH